MTAFSKNTYSFPLDIKRRTGVKLLGVNGDTANRFIVTLQDAGVNLDLTGLYVRAVFRRSDGVTVLQSESDSPANITKTTGGVVTIDVLNGSFRDGDNDMEIQVLDGDPDTGDVLITSARMLFRVRKELNSDDATESSHEYTVLQQFIDGLGNMTVTVETLTAGSSATAGLTIGDDYSYELALGIPRGADGSDGLNGVGIANIQALASIIDGSYSLKVTMTDSTIYTFPLPFYIKPVGGIPKTDLAAGVQASLGKADTALQEHQSLAGYATQTWVGQQGYLTEHQDLSAYRTASDQDVIDDAQDAAIAAKYTKPSGGIPTDDIANGAVTGYKIGDHEVTPDKLGEMEALRILGNNSLSPVNVKELTGAQVTAMLAAMSGASASSAGGKGLVPAPAAGDNVKFLRGDGSWQTVSGGGNITIDPVPTNASPNAVSSGGVYAALGNKQNTISDLDAIRSGAAAGATAVQPSAITDMATKTWVGQQGYLKQHQSLAAYRTASAQNTIDATKLNKYQGTANAGKLLVIGNDGVVAPKEDEYLFVDEIPANADHSNKYVLPDGYIYTWQEHTEYNANNANALLNMKPNTSANYDSTSAQSGVLTSDVIPWDSSWTSWEQTPTALTISGSGSLVPAYNSPIIVYYYKQDGSYKTAMLVSQMHSLGMPSNSDPITLPISFNLADNNLYPINDIGYVRVLLGISTSGNITAEDVAGLKISVPFYDSGPAESGWYSTGVKYATTEQLESQIAELQDNEIKVSTNQILYAVGDSITYGYGVGGNSGSWVHHVIERNGYDATNSLNLGESNLGFCTTSVSNHTIQDIVGGTDFSGADIVTVALGINDWKSSGATLSAFWAGMQYCFNKIRTDNPYCKLFYILPFNVAIGNSSYANFYGLGFVGDSDPTKPYSYALQTFINMIKDKLEEPTFKSYRINVIDMTECAAINRHNIQTALSDGLHPTAATHIELGKEIARRIILASGASGVLPVYSGGVS